MVAHAVRTDRPAWVFRLLQCLLAIGILAYAGQDCASWGGDVGCDAPAAVQLTAAIVRTPISCLPLHSRPP